MESLLPQAPGFLPKWIGLIGTIALVNGMAGLFSQRGTKEIYDRVKPSDLSPITQRLFSTWTFTSGIIRIYAAYNISDPTSYQLALWSFGIAFFHFTSELVAFKTLSLNRGSISPMIISTSSIVWMLLQRDFYLG